MIKNYKLIKRFLIFRTISSIHFLDLFLTQRCFFLLVHYSYISYYCCSSHQSCCKYDDIIMFKHLMFKYSLLAIKARVYKIDLFDYYQYNLLLLLIILSNRCSYKLNCYCYYLDNYCYYLDSYCYILLDISHIDIIIISSRSIF